MRKSFLLTLGGIHVYLMKFALAINKAISSTLSEWAFARHRKSFTKCPTQLHHWTKPSPSSGMEWVGRENETYVYRTSSCASFVRQGNCWQCGWIESEKANWNIFSLPTHQRFSHWSKGRLITKSFIVAQLWKVQFGNIDMVRARNWLFPDSKHYMLIMCDKM